jgi:enediyne biosynthesis protein E4
VRLENQTLTRQVMPTRSYLSQSELPVTIGLGRSDRIRSVEIIWPGGQVQRLDPLPRLDTLTRVVQAP